MTGVVETGALAVLLTVAIYAVRHHWRTLRQAWRDARWWERMILVLALLPVPGPLDELVGVLVVRRVIRRRGRLA